MAYASFDHHTKKTYRSVFLSDFHMGAKTFDAAAAVSFLKSFDCKYLFLVGDIIDGWKLNKRWHWNEECSQVIDELVKKQTNGTKIIYLPGNHDEEIRRFNPLARREFAHRIGIRIREKLIHQMADGRKFLVIHGDQFDRAILRGPLSQWGDKLYDWALDCLEGNPKIEITGRLKPFSLAKSLGKHGQWALTLLNNFEHNVYKHAHRHRVDGLICGHTHIPVIKNLKGITYANSGCWLRTSHTALTESINGDLNLVDWPCSAAPTPLFPHLESQQISSVTINTPVTRQRIMTNKIIDIIKDTWPENTKRENIKKQTTPKQWLAAQKRDMVTLEHRAIMPTLTILNDKRPINLATKIFLKQSAPQA